MTTKKRRNVKTWWKKIGICVIVITMIGSVILISPLQNKVKASEIPLSLFYTVTIPEKGSTFHIHIDIQGLLKGEFILKLFNSQAQESEQYSHIHNVTVEQGGVSLNVVYMGHLLWQTLSQNKKPMTVDYDVDDIIPILHTGFSTSHDVNVYVNSEKNCGMMYGSLVFLVPSNYEGYYASEIKIKFGFPKDNWILVCPYRKISENTYAVPHTARDLTVDFAQRRGIYFGKMKFYTEKKVGNCTIKYGILESDERGYTKIFIKNQKDLEYNVDLIAKAIAALTKMFGDNPYPVMPISDSISVNGWVYQSGAGIVGGNQFWPPKRYDETVGHLFYSWMRATFWTPTGADYLICKGIGECYLGNKLAYDIMGDKHYLGKIYANYLIYKAALGTKYFDREDIKDAYYKGTVVGLYLDNLIQKETNGKKSLEDVIGYLYRKYKNTNHTINTNDLEMAVNVITDNNNSNIFKQYVYGDQEIPVNDFIQPYKSAFPEFIKVLNSDNWVVNYHGYTIPYFINIEIAIRLPIHIPASSLVINHYDDFAKEILEKQNFDLKNLTKQNVINALNKLTKTNDNNNFFEQWKDSYGELTLDEIKSWLKSYLPYSPQNVSASVNNNSITLNWDQVKWRYLKNYYKIIGYNVYRGTEEGKEEKIATVTSNSYTNRNIETGKTYYYYITAIEDQPFGDGVHIESEPSHEIKVSTKDTTPPTITISSPEDGSETSNDSVNISGIVTDDLSGVASVTLNGNQITLSSDGSFSETVSLTEGTNTITITATDKAGNKATKTITVTYTPPVQTITITLQPDNPYMTVNGESQEIDPGRGTKPVIIPKWGRTVVPIRAIVEALGGTIGWDPTERKVTINFNNTVIELWIDKPQARVNGEMKWIDDSNHDVRPIIINDRTMLPLRFVAESLGCTVNWDGTTRTITITYGG